MLPFFTVCCVLLIFSSAPGQTDSPKRVLIIHSFGRDFEPYGSVATAFRTELMRDSPDTIVLYEATLDAGQKITEQEEQTFRDYLGARFAGNTPDLVVTLGPPAARFYFDNRDRLFPATPLLMGAVGERIAQGAPLRSGDTAVLVKTDFQVLVEDFLAVFPDTKTIAIAFGASALEHFWITELQNQLDRFKGRVQFVWLNDLTLEQMEARVATLPPHSAVFLGLFIIDAAGVPHDRAEMLANLRATANAPILGLYETDLGNGTVGGVLLVAAASRRTNGSRGDTHIAGRKRC
jgi:hypothetical protein